MYMLNVWYICSSWSKSISGAIFKWHSRVKYCLYLVPMFVIGSDAVLPSVTASDWVLWVLLRVIECCECYWVWLSVAKCYCVLLSVIGCYCVTLSAVQRDWVLTEYYCMWLNVTECYCVWCSVTDCYWLLFTAVEYDWVLLSVVGCDYILLS